MVLEEAKEDNNILLDLEEKESKPILEDVHLLFLKPTLMLNIPKEAILSFQMNKY